MGLVVESESEDEDDLPPRARQVQSILSIVGSLNKKASEACSYIRGKVSNRDVFALLLVDTGNTTPNDLISEEFFLAAELTWIPQDKAMRLGTADSSGGGLQVLGQVEQLKLHVEGMDKPIFLQPWCFRAIRLKAVKDDKTLLFPLPLHNPPHPSFPPAPCLRSLYSA